MREGYERRETGSGVEMDGAYELLAGEKAVGHELAGAEGDRRAGLGVRHGWEMELDAPPQGGEGELGAREERGLTAGWRHGKP